MKVGKKLVAANRLKVENDRLRKDARRTAAELQQQKRELEIETALESVRTVAMRMSKPGDLLNICEALFKAFKKLGFEGLRNAMINIHNDGDKTFINYDYSDEIGKSINPLSYDTHPVIEKQVKQIRKADDAFSKTVFEGKDLADWKRFRKKIGEKDDPRVNKCNALYYYFYSIGTGSIGISTFGQIKNEQLTLLKRFRNVFLLSYERYIDIAEAEAREREARIETALERVRAVAMAMRKPKELSGIGKVLFAELKSLGFIDLRNTEIIINNDSKETITSYYCDYGVSGVIEIDYRTNPIVLEWANELKKASNAFAEVIISEKEMTQWRTYREELGYQPGRKLNKAKTVYYYSYSIGLGALSISSFKPVAKEPLKILERFRNVFHLCYQRYTDIARAEEQARKAKIEGALERVRSRTMAMHQSEEIADILGKIFAELRILDVVLNTNPYLDIQP